MKWWYYFIYLFIYFNWRLITLQYCGDFWNTSPWISHGCTCVPSSQTPLPSSLPITSLWVTPVHWLWVPYFMHWTCTCHLVHIWFQCYSLKSSHPCLIKQSPKVCSLHMCLFCCLAYRVIITIFLNQYICVSILYWCFSFWLTSLCIIGFQFHPPH